MREILVAAMVLFSSLPATADPIDEVVLIAPIRHQAVGDTSGGHNRGCWEYNSVDPQLSKVASRHSSRMADRSLLYHSTDLRHVVTRWSTLGENVGTGPSVKSLHRAFMASPAHRDNILYPTFRHVGVGSARRGGRLWVTVVFEARRDPGTTLRVPRCR
jgi:hypothetical protein